MELKIENFCASKEPQESEIHRMRENILQILHLIRDCYPEYIKKLTTQKQKTNPHSKMGHSLKQTSFKVDMQMANEHKKRCSTSVAFRKCVILKLQQDTTSHP